MDELHAEERCGHGRHSGRIFTRTNELYKGSPINRPWYPLEAWRQPSVPILARVIECYDQAVRDDRLVEGILSIRSGYDIISAA